MSRSLPADLSAVREARLVVQRVLTGWRVGEIHDDVVLVASELVANALRHGLGLGQPRLPLTVSARGWGSPPLDTRDPGTGDPGTREPDFGYPDTREPGFRYSDLRHPDLRHGDASGVRISLVSTKAHVICAVTDPSEAPPVRQSGDDPLAGSGRGLQMIDSLSLCWGWTLLDGGTEVPAGQGKSVWAIFPLGRSGHARVSGLSRVAGAA